MLTFLMNVRTAWNDYFPGDPTLIQSKEFGTSQSPSGTSVYVLNCLFISTTSAGYGGALYCCNSATYLLVESSSFFSCTTSHNHGGAIYFYNSNNGHCVLYNVCGYDCYSTNTGSLYGDFIRTYLNNAASSKNYINYSSISRCSNENSNSYYTLYIGRGNICFSSVNTSMNKCYYQTVYCYPFSDSNSVTCSLIYSSFTDNIATGYTCLYLWQLGAKYEIKNCNILRNKQGTSGSQGTIYTNGYLAIEDSCILENNATYIFYASSYTITLSNCTVDSNSKYGTVLTQNTVTKSFILALNHMSTLNCHSDYDSAGYLTPLIQLTSKKQIHCYTCGNSFYQSRIGYLISLISVFLFSFIHLSDSNDPLN
jgi:hypothetical protein